MNAPADNPDIAETVEEAIASRRSIRRFLPTPVSRETVTELLALASRAPSGSNIQPWRVTVIGGETKAALSAAILEAQDGDEKFADHEAPENGLVTEREPVETFATFIDF